MKSTYDYEAARVILLQDIPVNDPEAPIDLVSMGSDLQRLVTNPANEGLKIDFKESVNQYSSPPHMYSPILEERRRRCIDEPNQWQSLVAVVPRPAEEIHGRYDRPLVVVGLGAVSIADKAIIPTGLGIDPASPNVSLFVDARHRRQHIGDRIVEKSNEIIDSLHDGLGWASVRPENVASQTLMRQYRHGYLYAGHKWINHVPKDHFVRDNRANV